MILPGSMPNIENTQHDAIPLEFVQPVSADLLTGDALTQRANRHLNIVETRQIQAIYPNVTAVALGGLFVDKKALQSLRDNEKHSVPKRQESSAKSIADSKSVTDRQIIKKATADLERVWKQDYPDRNSVRNSADTSDPDWLG